MVTKKKSKKRQKHLFLVAFVYGGNLQDMSVVNEKRIRAALDNNDWEYDGADGDGFEDAVAYLKERFGNQAVFTTKGGDNECKVVHIRAGINKQAVLL